MKSRFVRKNVSIAATLLSAIVVAAPGASVQAACGNHVPMHLVSSFPGVGEAIDASSRRALEITFDFPVSIAGATKGSVKLFRLIESKSSVSQRREVAGTISVSGSTVSFTPAHALPARANFVLTAYPSPDEGYWPRPPGIYSERNVGCRAIAMLKEEVSIVFTTASKP
jgi:hypothetical protein